MRVIHFWRLSKTGVQAVPASLQSSATGVMQERVRQAGLPGFTTAMDGGSVAIGRESMRPIAMDGGSAGAVGSGSSKNLEGLIGNN
jgi:hypothetical protein